MADPMTDSNLFQEIDEEVRQQKLAALWQRYGVVLLATAIAIVLGAGGYSGYSSWRTEHRQKTTAELMALTSPAAPQDAKQIEALQNFAQKNAGNAQGTFAALQAAALAAQSGDKIKAAEAYDRVAADGAVEPVFRQLADLRAVQLTMDDADPAVLQKRLQPLLADGAPWRYTAMEYSAFLALRAGDKAKARQIFTELAEDASAPKTLSARAADMLHVVAE